MITALEYLRRDESGVYNEQDIVHAMIQFTTIHCAAQAAAICDQARIIDDPNSYTGNTGSEYPPDQIVSKESILNAYPLTNIK